LLEPFADQATCELIRKMIKAGYVNMENLTFHKSTDKGIPQGSILSPLLCNLFLNDLDWFADEMLHLHNIGDKRAESLEYKRSRWLTAEDTKILEVYPELTESLKIVKHNRTLQKGLRRTITNDDLFSRLYYVRYADDLLIGYVGSKKVAVEIQQAFFDYIKNNLNMIVNIDKSNIKHGSNSIEFLGTNIR